ncbi:MAG: hypothetical protein Q8Q25_01190 [bacterium]|nr:hypothetical protein [bacterium]
MINRFTAIIIASLCSAQSIYAEPDFSDLLYFWQRQEGSPTFNWKTLRRAPATKEALVQSQRKVCITWLTQRLEEETRDTIVGHNTAQELRKHPDIAYAIEKCRQYYNCPYKETHPGFWERLTIARKKQDEEKKSEEELWRDFVQENSKRGREKLAIIGNLAVEDLENKTPVEQPQSEGRLKKLLANILNKLITGAMEVMAIDGGKNRGR